MGLSSISSITVSAAQSVYKSNANKAVAESPQTSTSRTSSGDTVQISDKARSSLQSSQSGSDTGTATSDSSGSSEKGGTGGTSATGAGSGAAGGTAVSGSSSSTSSSSSDERARLEKEIRALQQEIAVLTARALTDDTAKGEMSAKQTEMAGLMAQLTQLQLQQA